MAQLGDLIVSGKSRFLNKISGSCTNGTTVSSQSQTTKFLREDGEWAAPSYTTNVDTKVTQSPSTINSNFEVILSGTADNTERAETVKKSTTLLFNPNQSALTIGTRATNSTIGQYSVSMGASNTASGYCSQALGNTVSATNNNCHAEGYQTLANMYCAHAEGWETTASGQSSHAEGEGTIANHRNQHVFGMFNIADPSTQPGDANGTYIEIVGKGGGSASRSNARTLDWGGNEWLASSLTVGVNDDNSYPKSYVQLSYNASNPLIKITYQPSAGSLNSLTLDKTGVSIVQNASSLNVKYNDITFSASSNPPTWDGTNTSLVTAVTNAKTKYKDQTVTIPSSQTAYNGYYYQDYNLSSLGIAADKILSVSIVLSTYNYPAFVQLAENKTRVRVYCPVADSRGRDITFRVAYLA